MIRLAESTTPKVGGYMLSRWDEVIPVKYHPYGESEDNIDSITNNVACAWFLYNCGKKTKIGLNNIFLNYICYCVDYLADTLDYEDLDAKGETYKNLLYQIFEECDVDNCLNNWNHEKIDIKKFLFNMVKDKTLGDLLDLLDESNNGIEAFEYMNQNYTRFRVGGEYDNYGENEIYFRISSSGYDWGDDIIKYLFNNCMSIKYVTIERDSESSSLNGRPFKIYTLDGVPINHMPIKDLVYANKEPILSSINKHMNNKLIIE